MSTEIEAAAAETTTAATPTAGASGDRETTPASSGPREQAARGAAGYAAQMAALSPRGGGAMADPALRRGLLEGLAAQRDRVTGGDVDDNPISASMPRGGAEVERPGLRMDLLRGLAAQRERATGGGPDNPVADTLAEDEFFEARRGERQGELDAMAASPAARVRRMRAQRDAEGGRRDGAPDAPLTMHDDQLGRFVLAELRDAMVAYVTATRAKETLRSELGVSKLDKVKRAALVADPGLQPRIDAARRGKVAAKAAYDAALARAKRYLATARAPEIEEQISAIDARVLGASAESSAARDVEHRRAEQIGGAASLTETLVLAEAQHPRLLRSMQALSEAGVGSREFSFQVGVSFGFGLGSGSRISVGGGFKYAGQTDIQDDRRLRVTHAMGAYGKSEAQLAAVLSASVGVELMRGNTEVFTDAEHWAAEMAFRFGKIQRAIRGLETGQEVDESLAVMFEDHQGQLGEIGQTREAAMGGASMTVSSTSVSGALDASLVGYGAKGGYARSWMTFHKRGADGQDQTRRARKSDKTFELSPGANLKATVTRTLISGHANPDNDGRYFNIKLTLLGSAAGKLAARSEPEQDAIYGEWERDLRRSLGTAAQPSADAGGGVTVAEQALVEDAADAHEAGLDGSVAAAVSGYLSSALARVEAEVPAGFDAAVSVTGKAQRSIEWNFVATGRTLPRLQYRRISGGKSLEVAASVPVGSVGAADASLDVGASRSTSLMQREVLGTNTLTYLATVFNGLRPRERRADALGRGDAAQWSGFVQAHRPEIWQVFRHASTTAGDVAIEVRNALSEAALATEDPAEVPALGAATREAEAFLTACEERAGALTGDYDPDVFGALEAALNRYFGAQAALTAIQQAAHWSGAQYGLRSE